MTWWQRALNWLLLIGVSLVFLGPVLVMVVSGFKPDDAVLAHGDDIRLVVPDEVTLANYREILGRDFSFEHFLLNSVLIVGTIVLVGLFVNSLAGYALARLRWPGRRLVLAMVVAVLIVPYEAIAVPLFAEVALFGWTNSYHVQIIPFIANPFAIWLFYTFFRELPQELEEAARIDGAGTFRTFISIVAPLARPAYAAVAILTFLLHWGFFLWPLMVTRGPQYQPLPVALGYLSQQRPMQWGDLMAFGTLMVLPVLIVFLLFQRWFVRGIAMTGMKG